MTITAIHPTPVARSPQAASPSTGFSVALADDHLQIRQWVHDFAAGVIRPAAHEWDEREETPWPIIEEAARVGLYSLDFVAMTLPGC
jgi:alkylation response protein AidB-like acyl-CoA dehydrogenase